MNFKVSQDIPRSGKTTVCLRSGDNRILLPGGAKTRPQMEAFLSDPAGSMAKGLAHKQGSRGFAGVTSLAGQDCFVKHYRHLGLVYAIKNFFRTARAARTWKVSWELISLGLRVPAPLFCIVERRFRLLGDSYLATEFIVGGVDLLKYWRANGVEQRKAVLRKCAEMIGAMHAARWCHGDLKWQNILVVESGGQLETVLVDVDAARRHCLTGRRHATNDMNRFVRDLKKARADEEMVRLFVSAWEERVTACRNRNP